MILFKQTPSCTTPMKVYDHDDDTKTSGIPSTDLFILRHCMIDTEPSHGRHGGCLFEIMGPLYCVFIYITHRKCMHNDQCLNAFDNLCIG